MNLGKLFNFKYLKQNIKKSKGFITVLAFIIPVITALILVANNSSEYYIVTHPTLVYSGNFLGMYIIPIVISFLLYGYVYKKNSVDFVNSMPITRTTIFTTNFICGVVLMAIIQVLTAIVTAICAAVLSKIYIAPAMILDIMFIMFIGYTFVFACASLAMTVSGNVLTQIVVTMLILFLVPFVWNFGLADINKELGIELENRVITINQEIANNNSTLPSSIFETITDNSYAFFNISRDIKTVILTIIYFFIGLYLFNKRKMENTEISFSKTWVHLAVKGITLVPMIFILQLLEIKGVFYAISIILIFIYYCLYDFITNKKISPKFTLPTFIVCVILIIGLDRFVNYIGTKMFNESILIDDISSVSVELAEFTNMQNTIPNNNLMFNIEDKNLIKKICENLVDKTASTYEYSGNYNDHYPNETEVISLNFKLNNGKEKYSKATIDYNIYQEVFELAINDEKTLNKYSQYYKLGEDTYIIGNESNLSDENTKLLIDIYNNLDSRTLLEIENEFLNPYNRNSVPSPCFSAYTYKNHELIEIRLNSFFSQELFNKITEFSWDRLKEVFEEVDSDKNKTIDVYVSEMRVAQHQVQNNNRCGSLQNNEGIINYVKEHMNEKIDMNDNFYVINVGSIYPYQSTIYLKETEELNNILDRDIYNVYEVTEKVIDTTY